MATRTEIGVGIGIAAVALTIIGIVVRRKSGQRKPPPPQPPPPDPPFAFAVTVADSLAATRKLELTGDSEQNTLHRHQYFFAFRRARDLGEADPTLKSGPGLETLKTRVGKEMALIDAFLAPRFTTPTARGEYFGGPPPSGPFTGPSRLLDLGVHAAPRKIDFPTTEAAAVSVHGAAGSTQKFGESVRRTLLALDLRKRQVATIVWRAAAIEDRLWFGLNTAPELREAPLALLLDRRLRTLDRVRYQVSAGATANGMGSSNIDGRVWNDRNSRMNTFGPWQDSYTLRPFEAPSVPRKARSTSGLTGDWSIEDFLLPFGKREYSLSIDGSASGGSFRLDLDGNRTPPIPFDIKAPDMELLMNSAAPDNLVIQARDGDLPFGTMTLFITGTLSPAELTVHDNSLTGGATQPKPKVTRNSITPDVASSAESRFGFARHWWLNFGTDELDWNILTGTRVTGDQWKLAASTVTRPGYAWVPIGERESQTLNIPMDAVAGIFTLKLGNRESGAIPAKATGEQLAAALAQIPNGDRNFIVLENPEGTSVAPSFTIVYANDQVTDELVMGDNRILPASAPAPSLSGKNFNAIPAGQVIGNLFEPQPTTGGVQLDRADWWKRSWLHSDGMLAAAHLDGLRHGLLRQEPFDDVAFENINQEFRLALDDYFGERTTVAHVSGAIMTKGRNDFFENGSVVPDDLQPGDQVLFETNPAMVAAGATVFDYPTVLVTDVDVALEPAQPPVFTSAGLSVQGVNTADHRFGSFQKMMARAGDVMLDGMRAYIEREFQRQKTAAPPPPAVFAPKSLPWDVGVLTREHREKSDPLTLRPWNPYDSDRWLDPGPWWLWVNLDGVLFKDRFGTDILTAAARFPGGIMWEKSARQVLFLNSATPWRLSNPLQPRRMDTVDHFVDPPIRNDKHPSDSSPETVVFVPLYQPSGGWERYFENKSKTLTPVPPEFPLELFPVKTDGRWFSGLAFDAEKPTQARVIRPRAKSFFI